MITVIIPLKDFILDKGSPLDLTTLPEKEALSLLKESYKLYGEQVDVVVSNGFATITLSPPPRKASQATELFERGNKKAQLGDYKAAIPLFTKSIELVPSNHEVRRNLAMSWLELGEIEKAIDHLIDTLRLNPSDVWARVLMGNIYAKHKDDTETARKYYQKAYEIDPNDPYLLNNYATVLLESGKADEAERMYRESMERNPQYPNVYLGLANVLIRRQDLDGTLEVMDGLFETASKSDPRSEQVFQSARDLYLQTARAHADIHHSKNMQVVDERRQSLEKIGGVPITIEEDEELKIVLAQAQLAWAHKRDHHRITYRPGINGATAHLLYHELEHIALSIDARNAGRNKIFVSDAAGREHAILSVQKDIERLAKKGVDEKTLTQVTLELVQGLNRQLFNLPLDMIIEARIHDRGVLRYSQFASLNLLHLEALHAVTNKDVTALTPRKILTASAAMNCAQALSIDWICSGRTKYATLYESTGEMQTGQRLLDSWKSCYQRFKPGDEYDLVDEFARMLSLQEWYKLIPDKTQDEEHSGGPTNPELLSKLQPASVMYLVGALERFEHMAAERIREVGFEIALLGQTGIDYTKADQRYSLKSLPGEQFSGLQLLSLMYVAFQKIDPSLNTGVDFKEAYELAQKMYKPLGDKS